MKKNILIIVTLFLLNINYSCSDELPTNVEETQISDTDMNAPIVNSGSFEIGPFGGLGYGYDVTGEFANANSSRHQVIDIIKLEKEELPGKIMKDWPRSQEYRLECVENALQFSNVLSRKLDITNGRNLFGKALSANFSKTMTNDNKFEKKYIYSSGTIKIINISYRVISTSEVLQKYLTPEFLQDIDLKTPQQIVNDYGTHVMLNICIGARMNILYQSETSNPDRKVASRVGIESAMGDVFFIPSINDNSSLISKNYSQRLSFKTIGGEPSKSINGYLNLEQPNPKISIADWQKTVTSDNSYLVDIREHGLIYIYDLISDPAKKAVLKEYVDQYLIDNEVKLN